MAGMPAGTDPTAPRAQRPGGLPELDVGDKPAFSMAADDGKPVLADPDHFAPEAVFVAVPQPRRRPEPRPPVPIPSPAKRRP